MLPIQINSQTKNLELSLYKSGIQLNRLKNDKEKKNYQVVLKDSEKKKVELKAVPIFKGSFVQDGVLGLKSDKSKSDFIQMLMKQKKINDDNFELEFGKKPQLILGKKIGSKEVKEFKYNFDKSQIFFQKIYSGDQIFISKPEKMKIALDQEELLTLPENEYKQFIQQFGKKFSGQCQNIKQFTFCQFHQNHLKNIKMKFDLGSFKKTFQIFNDRNIKDKCIFMVQQQSIVFCQLPILKGNHFEVGVQFFINDRLSFNVKKKQIIITQLKKDKQDVSFISSLKDKIKKKLTNFEKKIKNVISSKSHHKEKNKNSIIGDEEEYEDVLGYDFYLLLGFFAICSIIAVYLIRNYPILFKYQKPGILNRNSQVIDQCDLRGPTIKEYYKQSNPEVSDDHTIELREYNDEILTKDQEEKDSKNSSKKHKIFQGQNKIFSQDKIETIDNNSLEENRENAKESEKQTEESQSQNLQK